MATPPRSNTLPGPPDPRGVLALCLALSACSGDNTPDSTSGASDDTTASNPASTSGPTTADPTTSDLPTTSDAPTTTTPGTTGPDPTSTTTDPTPGTTTDTTTGATQDGGLSQRPADPIVLLGGQLPGLAAVPIADIVGFARRDGAWVQVPIQVDERVRIDFCTVYARALLGDNAPCKTSQIINALFYADPKTYTGADTDPAFDIDDELVFMARDAGDQAAPGSSPDGVLADTSLELAVVDGDETGWLYLFQRSDDQLEPGAGADLVSYTLEFTPPIDYLSAYPFVGKGSCGDAICDPPILEDSIVKSPHYERHFVARWVTDSLKLTTEGSTGKDLLDLAQARFAPNVCGRHVLTFSTSEGAFIANIDGPVRAIRSYMGANSGPLTQRTHLFYDRAEVVQTFLRVHTIPGIMELIDYAADAPGMTYFNEHNEAGLAIDGVPDPGFDTAQFSWELISGPHGSVVSVLDPRFSKPFGTIAYYEDDAKTKNNQCSASNTVDSPDDQAFGTSGMWVNAGIPDTDPRNGSLDYLFISRTSYYDIPDLELAAAKQIVARAKAPPQTTARSFTAPGPACGDTTCDPGEDTTCALDCNPIDNSCGDGICDLWENSVNCAKDCSTGGMGSMCGDKSCDPGEHELNCNGDCWTPAYAPLVACMNQKCPVQLGACNDELPCVDRVVCTAECVAGGGTLAACTTSCANMIPATPEQQGFTTTLLMCASMNCN